MTDGITLCTVTTIFLMKLLLNTIITLAGISCSTVAFTCSPQSTNRRVAITTSFNEKENGNDIMIQTTRREALINGAAAATGIVLVSPNNALAFDNKISDKYSDRPRQRGSKVRAFLICIVHILCFYLIVHSSHIIIL